MKKALQNDAYLFGPLKVHAQLFEASKLLLNEDGRLKPFSALSHEFDKLNINYNQNYLEAEYEFAVASSQSAAQWANFGSSDRYNLQYRTAKDERVRASHQALADITLPKEDPFWSYFYPPNGWRCRCTAVEVLKGKYEVSNSEKAITAGEKATTEIGKNGKNRLEIFRFNPGQKQVLFPPNHPYSKVSGAKEVIKQNENKFVPEGLNNYEKTLGIKIDKSFFNYLTKETKLLNTLPNNQKSGAFYNPDNNYVHIPFDRRRKNSKWYAEAVVYHEFGHAADWHNSLKSNRAVLSLMKEYRKSLTKDDSFRSIEIELNKKFNEAIDKEDHNIIEQCGAVADTLMSLNKNWGFGHSKSYFSQKGKSEAEFIAHMFENRFAGNKVFEDLIPELYNDMKKLADELKPK